MSVDAAVESSAAPSVGSAYEAQSDTSKTIGTMNELAEKNGTLGSVDDTAENSKEDEGVTVALPQSLFSEGVEHGSADRAMPREMTEEERKAAAMKTIAQLQEWAAKANNSATSGVTQTSRGMQQGVQMNGGQNDNQVRLAMLLQQQQQREAQQILLQQQQQQQQQQQARKRSDVLQRIIQDYLQGKQLSVYELQVLQQYIQQQQQQRTAAHPGYAMPTVQRQQPSYLSGNGMSTAVPDYANAYYAREQRPQYPVGPQGSLSEAVRLQQERIAAAAAAGQAQARLSQIQREAMLAMHAQKPAYQNTSAGMSLEDQLLAMARSGSHTSDLAARINAQQYLNGATLHQGIENGLRNPQYQQPMYGDAMRQQQTPSMYYQNGQASMPANGHIPRSANSTQNLQDIGKTLAQLGISVEGAVNAGLLGGLSASDVRVVAESHRLTCERVPLPNGNGVSTAPPFAGGTRSHSFGNLSAPAPSSPVGSIGNVSSTSLPVNIQQSALSPTSKSTSNAEDDHEQALLDQIISEDQQTNVKKNVVDEEWLTSKVEHSSSTFNASRYGFFGQEDSTALSDELERYADDEKKSGEDDKLSDYLAGLKLGTGFM